MSWNCSVRFWFVDSPNIQNDQRRIEHVESLRDILEDILTVDLLPDDSDWILDWERPKCSGEHGFVGSRHWIQHHWIDRGPSTAVLAFSWCCWSCSPFSRSLASLQSSCSKKKDFGSIYYEMNGWQSSEWHRQLHWIENRHCWSKCLSLSRFIQNQRIKSIEKDGQLTKIDADWKPIGWNEQKRFFTNGWLSYDLNCWFFVFRKFKHLCAIKFKRSSDIRSILTSANTAYYYYYYH